MKYFSRRFDSEHEMIDYANKQLKYGTELHSFSVQGDMECSCIIAVFIERCPNYAYKYEQVKYYNTTPTTDKQSVVYTMMN